MKIGKRIFLNEINKTLFAMVLPGAVFLLIFNYLPMLGVLLSFKNYKIVGTNIFENFAKSPWIGFKNFEVLFNTPDAYTITRNTVLYNLAFIIFGLIFSVFIAIAINELSNKFLAKLYQTMFFLPYFISWVVVGYLALSLLSTEHGVINSLILKPLGIEPIDWYNQPKYWPFILIVANLWKYAGCNSIVYLAAITGFDNEYYEAAIIDGASRWKQITNITLPLLVPLMTTMSILAVGRIFSADFGLFFNLPLGSGSLYPVTNVIDVYVYRALISSFQVSMPTAIGLYQGVVGFVLVIITNTIVKRISKDYALF